MRKIAIIGSGQAGLLAAHALLQTGYQVTLYSDKTAEQWLNHSKPTGSAARFAMALQYEAELGLDFWGKEASKVAKIEGVDFSFHPNPGNKLLGLVGRFSGPALAIDLRLQSHKWMQEFKRKGGKLIIEKVTMDRLHEIGSINDLTIVAAGNNELREIFKRDPQRSVYQQPQRHLAMVIVKGKLTHKVPFNPVNFHVFDSHGEIFWQPFYHKDKVPAWCLLFEAIPGGALDRFQQVRDGDQALSLAKKALSEFLPREFEQMKYLELADDHGWIVGKVLPSVREPVGYLSNGTQVLAIGDTCMSLDPIGGQGANNGNKMVKCLVQSIVKNGEHTFDASWMKRTFENFYNQHGKHINSFNNLLLEPMTEAGKELFMAQYGSDGSINGRYGKQAIANYFVDNFNDPRTITPILKDKKKARAFIQEITGKYWLWSAINGRLQVAGNQIKQKIFGTG